MEADQLSRAIQANPSSYLEHPMHPTDLSQIRRNHSVDHVILSSFPRLSKTDILGRRRCWFAPATTAATQCKSPARNQAGIRQCIHSSTSLQLLMATNQEFLLVSDSYSLWDHTYHSICLSTIHCCLLLFRCFEFKNFEGEIKWPSSVLTYWWSFHLKTATYLQTYSLTAYEMSTTRSNDAETQQGESELNSTSAVNISRDQIWE